jgi:hypothetical protein
VNGSFALPQGPGSGISLDDAKIAEREVLTAGTAAGVKAPEQGAFERRATARGGRAVSGQCPRPAGNRGLARVMLTLLMRRNIGL